MCLKCRLIERFYKRHGWNSLIERDYDIIDVFFAILEEVWIKCISPFRFLGSIFFYKYHKKE